MKSINKLAGLMSYVLLGTSVYTEKFKEIQKDLKIVDNKPTKYIPSEKKVEKVIPKNHKLFSIEGVEIYALNYKNALRKYNKLKINKSEEDWEQYELNL